MEFLKDLFENGSLDWDTFSNSVKTKGIKLVDLSKGEYVSKNKYDDDINAKTSQINDLSEQMKQRNTDLETLQNQVKDAQDNKTKLTEVSAQLATLKDNYTKAEENYKNQIAHQQCEFAIKEFANQQKFSSSAAKRDFIRGMMEKDLKFEDDKLIGANDYLDTYKKENANAFLTESEPKKPQFSSSTTNTPNENKNPFASAFHFIDVKPRPEH